MVLAKSLHVGFYHFALTGTYIADIVLKKPLIQTNLTPLLSNTFLLSKQTDFNWVIKNTTDMILLHNS